jgi:hypothetical protein
VLPGYDGGVARADWTYQVPAGGAPSAGLEEYLVEASSGERVGKVQTVVRRANVLYVVVERGSPPLTHDLRAVPWEEVENVDHGSLAIRLRMDDESLGRALELNPANKVEDGEADAARVTDLPSDLRRPSVPTPEAGPVDRPTYVAAIGLGALGLFALLVLIIVITAAEAAWLAAFAAVPALLFVAAGILAYRTFRFPYESR